MADKHPYTIGGAPLTQMVNQLRRSFPDVVNSDTLKKLGIAPNNESYIINTLRFLGVIDNEGKKTSTAETVFSKHEDSDFGQAFSQLVKDSYTEIFKLHSDAAWTLERSKLISFFRSADKTGAEVGKRQASTFETLSALAGQAGEKAKTAAANKPKTATKTKVKPAKPAPTPPPVVEKVEKDGDNANKPSRDFALTVRIEINLPAEADQAHYDMMFRSIRENLINAK